MEMKNIINYAIRNGEINKDMLASMINQMDDDMAVRFTEAILGIVYPEEIEIPKMSNVYDHKDCRFLRYNYLKDNVEYECDEEVVRYFETKEDAEKFDSGKLFRWAGDRSISDEFQFEGRHVFTEKETCSLTRWLEGAK